MIEMLITLGAWALIWSSSVLGGALLGSFGGAALWWHRGKAEEGSGRGAHYGTIVGFMLPGLYLWAIGMLWALETTGVWPP